MVIECEFEKSKEMKKYIIMLMVAAAMVACTEDPNNEVTPNLPNAGKVKVSLNAVDAASANDMSRTALNEDGKSINWLAGDRIAVWNSDASQSVIYTTKDGGHRRAIFEAEVFDNIASSTEDAILNQKLYGFYPFNGSWSYTYDSKTGEKTDSTFVQNITSVSGSTIGFTLGTKASTSDTYIQYTKSVTEEDIDGYSSKSVSHYDVLYGQIENFDGADAMFFHHAFTGVRFAINADNWYIKDNTYIDGTNVYEAGSNLLLENNVLSKNAKLQIDYIQLDFVNDKVCGPMTLDAATGTSVATKSSLGVYTSGLTSGDGSEFWAFFPASGKAMEFDLTVYGTITTKDGETIRVQGYKRENMSFNFQNGSIHDIKLTIKNFKIAPVEANVPVTYNHFDLNGELTSLDQMTYGFRTYANWTNYLFESPTTSLDGWYFDCCELANGDNTVNPWGNENSAVLAYDRIRMVREMDNNNAAAFCTAPIVLPEGVASATAKVTFDLMWDSFDTGSSYVYVANIAGNTENGDGTVYSAVKGSADETISVRKDWGGIYTGDKAAAGQSATFTIANGERIGFAYQLDNIITDWMDDFNVLHRMTVYNLKIEITYTQDNSTPGYIF